MNIVEIKFQSKASINRGSYFLLSKGIAIDFINECELNKIEILGIDGFYKIDEFTIQPSMEHSIDFSGPLANKINIYQQAIDFINNRKDELYFEIVCG
jgi:hypothetical protein